MTTRKSLLDELSIPSPCSSNWSDLVGSERQRYCEQCERHVYDFSKLTAREAEALLTTLRGRVCARITWQADGTVLTEQALPVLPLARRRPSALASVAVTTMITLTASPAGRPLAQAASIVQTDLDFGTPFPDQTPQPGDSTASIVGTVVDQNKGLIPGARVWLFNQATREIRVVTSSDAGEFRFSGLGEGTFNVRVESSGFATSVIQEVTVSSQQEQRVDVTMQVGEVKTVTSGLLVSIPKPLRVLYNESDLIVVARIGESKTVERDREARRVKTALRVSSILKGKSEGPTVDLYHWSYGDLDGPFVAGEQMLLFLKRSKPEPGRKARGGYELDDTQYGIKKVAGSDLKAYLDRIAELSRITRENGPIEAAIVEWLVRCAEDPATRWEGAYELVASIDRHSEPEAEKETATESTASTSPEPDSDEQDTDEDSHQDPDFAALLTVEQKTRLMTALFQIKELQDRDLELIELAQRWKEPRLVQFLIEQLRRFEAKPPRLAERLIDSLAAALKDKAITDLAEEYRDNVRYPDEEVDQESGNASAQSDKSESTNEATAAIQTRSQMLGKFLQAVEVALAEKRSR